jgi:PAS domain S-box-containing protein
VSPPTGRRPLEAGSGPIKRALVSDHGFRELFLGHPQPAWVCDAASGRVLEVNDAALALLGGSREHFVPLAPPVPGGGAESGPETGRPVRTTVRGPDGRTIGLELEHRRVTLAGRAAVLTVVREPAAAAPLAEMRTGGGERYRSIVDHIKQVIFQTDARGRWTFLNAAWTDVTGFTVEESLGTSFLTYVHPDDRQAHAELFQPLIERRDEYFGIHARYLTKAGGVRCLEVYARLAHDAAGGVSGTSGTLMDVTERKRAEEELHAARARLHHLLSSSPTIIYSAEIAPAPRLTFVSDNVARLLGYEPQELLEAPAAWADRIHPEDAERVTAELARLSEVAHQSLAYRVRHRDGTYRWLHDERRLVRAPGAERVEVIGSWLDITERHTGEQARAELEGQLRQAQKLEAIGQLAGGIAHDFNNLLTVITGRSELLLRRVGHQSPLTPDLDLVVRTAERAASLTRQLLAFSRKQVLEPRVLDLNGIVANMERMLRRLIGEDVDLAIRLATGLWRVRADPGQIEQVLLNLSVNARDAMPRGGRLTIETINVELDEAGARRLGSSARPGAHVLLAVADTGCGMDAETLSHVFEPFFTTKGPEQGTGLGLSTVYGIVKQSEGEIAVESEPGRGTTFRIFLPRVAARESIGERPRGPAYPRGTETVLLVEDEDAVRRLAREILRIAGYTVLEASNGAMALDVASRHTGRIDLLVTDVVMPGMGGRELAEALQAERPGTRVLYLSGYTSETIGRHGVEGSDALLLHKPFSPASLARTVREVLDARGTEPAVTLDPREA